MSEWDKLWLNENEPRSWMGYVNDTAWILKVKTEGDKMREEGDQLQSHVNHVDYENTLLKAENNDLGVTIIKQACKLEAIRRAVDNPDYAFLGREYTIARIKDILESLAIKKPFPRDEDWEEGITN